MSTTLDAKVEPVKQEQEQESEPAVDPMTRQLNNMAELLETLGRTSKSLTVEMKALAKDVQKLRVSKTKKVKRVVDPDAPRKMGALEKPVPISEELSDFLGLEKGELYSRQIITKTINKYVKDNELQNPENRRYILLESEAGLKLKALLRDPDQPLTFFNIQRYLKVHYPKQDQDSDSLSTAGKTVDLSEPPPPPPTPTPTPTDVVADTDTVDETEAAEVPKKKVVRKVVRKSA